MAFPRTAMKEKKSVISQRDNIEGVCQIHVYSRKFI